MMTSTTTSTTGTTSCLIQLVWLLSLQLPWDLQWEHIVYMPIMPSTVCTHLQQLWESEQDQTGLDRSARWSGQWWSRGGPTGSKGVRRYAYRVPACQGVGLQSPRGSRGRPSGSKGVQGLAKRVPRGQGVGLQGPRGSRGRSTGSQRFKG